MRTYYFRLGNDVIGPMSLDDLRKFVSVGNVKADTLVSYAPQGKWFPASNLSELRDDGASVSHTSAETAPNRTVPARENAKPKRFYFQHSDGRGFGPITGRELRDAAVAGDVNPETLVSMNPAISWAPASRVQGLFDESGRAISHEEYEATIPPDSDIAEPDKNEHERVNYTPDSIPGNGPQDVINADIITPCAPIDDGRSSSGWEDTGGVLFGKFLLGLMFFGFLIYRSHHDSIREFFQSEPTVVHAESNGDVVVVATDADVATAFSVVGRWRTENTGQFVRDDRFPIFTLHEFAADGSYSFMFLDMNAGFLQNGETMMANGGGTWQRDGRGLTFRAIVQAGRINPEGHIEQNPITGGFYHTGPVDETQVRLIDYTCDIVALDDTSMILNCRMVSDNGIVDVSTMRLERVR